MKIGLIFAEDEELDSVKSKMIINNEISIYNLKIYECNYKSSSCYLVKCGVGKVNAARTTQILISNFNVDCIINMGVAGSISKDINKCDVVIASKLVQYDFDLTRFGREKGFVPNTGKYFESDIKLLDVAKKIKCDENIFVGIIASGDAFVSSLDIGKMINKEFNALCVEMEGASIAQVCCLANIPFLVIRSISDSLYDKDNHSSFEEFLVKSSIVGSKILFELLDNYIG